MKIVVFEAEDRELAAFRALSPVHDVVTVKTPLTPDLARQHGDADVAAIFIYSRIDNAILDAMPGLKLIATRSTGFDHIDLAACARHGVTVCNVPSYGENTVAEHVFALLLAISHRLIEASARARTGHFSPGDLIGFDLQGRTLGVIGTGSIGRHVVRIGLGFGMRVLGHDPHHDEALRALAGFSYVDLETLLHEADVISLHVPSMPATHHLISEETIARMKDGVVVVNTARGDLIDVRALVRGLRDGKIAGAGLDVLPEEPLIREEAELICSRFPNGRDLTDLVADHVLLNMPNVVVTPHSAFFTREATARIVDTTVRNITAFVAGRPENVVARSL